MLDSVAVVAIELVALDARNSGGSLLAVAADGFLAAPRGRCGCRCFSRGLFTLVGLFVGLFGSSRCGSRRSSFGLVSSSRRSSFGLVSSSRRSSFGLLSSSRCGGFGLGRRCLFLVSWRRLFLVSRRRLFLVATRERYSPVSALGLLLVGRLPAAVAKELAVRGIAVEAPDLRRTLLTHRAQNLALRGGGVFCRLLCDFIGLNVVEGRCRNQRLWGFCGRLGLGDRDRFAERFRRVPFLLFALVRGAKALLAILFVALFAKEHPARFVAVLARELGCGREVVGEPGNFEYGSLFLEVFEQLLVCVLKLHRGPIIELRVGCLGLHHGGLERLTVE